MSVFSLPGQTQTPTVNRITKSVIGFSEHVVKRLSTGHKKANAKFREVGKSSASE